MKQNNYFFKKILFKLKYYFKNIYLNYYFKNSLPVFIFTTQSEHAGGLGKKCSFPLGLSEEPVWKWWCSAGSVMLRPCLCPSSSRIALPGGMRVGKQGMLHCNGDTFRFGIIIFWVSLGKFQDLTSIKLPDNTKPAFVKCLIG